MLLTTTKVLFRPPVCPSEPAFVTYGFKVCIKTVGKILKWV